VFPTGAVGRVELDDLAGVDEVATGWSHVHRQVGRGPAKVRVSLLHTSRLQLGMTHRSPGVLVRGSAPRSSVTFAVLLEGERQWAQRMPWSLDRVSVLPPDAEFEVLSLFPHRVLTVAVEQELLDEVSLARWGDAFPRLGSGPILRFSGPEARARLIATWSSWIAFAQRQPLALLDSQVSASLEQEVLGALFDGTMPPLEVPPVRLRWQLALRAERYIRDTVREPLSLSTLCLALRTRPRTLHASFQEAFGTSPMAYSRALRLDAVHTELRQARPGATVSSVAARWGFLQFGYFAGSYRRAFGERPRDTLRSALGLGGLPAGRAGQPTVP
jgi:AraC family ethanolamine operon transcriptional activator